MSAALSLSDMQIRLSKIGTELAALACDMSRLIGGTAINEEANRLQLINAVREEAARLCDTTTRMVASVSRKEEVVNARHLAMWVCRTHLEMTLESIGEHFARDHGAVISATRRIAELPDTEPLAQLRDQLSTWAQDRLSNASQA